MTWLETETETARLALDPAIGNIRRLEFRQGARVLAPLYSAPWAEDTSLCQVPDPTPLLPRLAGDFFCMPFGGDTLDGSPPHGWTANAPWILQENRAGLLRLVLGREVMGAQVVKTLQLAENAPLLYQTHEITGGAGQVTLAHHPMIRLLGRGRFSTSAKRAILTPDTPLEPGRNRLALGQRATDLTRVPASDGGHVDLQALPIADRHEDFVTLVEAETSALGWSAVVREAENDIVFTLKTPATLPVTMLWHSNGGRDYAPWNGRHTGVLGIEDGCAAGAGGQQAALAPNAVSQEGVPTALTLGPRHRIAHVLGAIPCPTGWTRIADIATEPGQLILRDSAGDTRTLPFDTDFLKKEP